MNVWERTKVNIGHVLSLLVMCDVFVAPAEVDSIEAKAAMQWHLNLHQLGVFICFSVIGRPLVLRPTDHSF